MSQGELSGSEEMVGWKQITVSRPCVMRTAFQPTGPQDRPGPLASTECLPLRPPQMPPEHVTCVLYTGQLLREGALPVSLTALAQYLEQGWARSRCSTNTDLVGYLMRCSQPLMG